MFFAEMVHVCMAYVWTDAKSLRQSVCILKGLFIGKLKGWLIAISLF